MRYDPDFACRPTATLVGKIPKQPRADFESIIFMGAIVADKIDTTIILAESIHSVENAGVVSVSRFMQLALGVHTVRPGVILWATSRLRKKSTNVSNKV